MDRDGGLLVILRALGLGDFLTAVPAFKALARAFPDHRKLLAAPPVLAPLVRLVEGLDGLVATAPLQSLDSRLARADVAVNLHGRGPQSHRVLIATEPRRLIAFRNRHVAETAGSPRWEQREHEVGRWCRLLTESGVPCNPGDLDLRAPGDAPADALGATLIHPGAASAARRWPVERWAAVARHERVRGGSVIVTGGPDEVTLAETVARLAGLGEGAVYAGRTDLGDLARLVSAAGLVVCGDTGVAHLATAFDTPSVVLFGPTSPREWGPPPERPRHRVVWTGGTGDPHGDEPHEGLLAISVPQVIDALAELEEGRLARAL